MLRPPGRGRRAADAGRRGVARSGARVAEHAFDQHGDRDARAHERAHFATPDCEHRCERKLGDEATHARVAEELPGEQADEQEHRPGPRGDEQRAERGRDTAAACSPQERRPVVADDRESTRDGGDGGSVAREQRTDRALGDVEDARDRERPEAGDTVERGS